MIELLVVIAILIALLLPDLDQADLYDAIRAPHPAEWESNLVALMIPDNSCHDRRFL